MAREVIALLLHRRLHVGDRGFDDGERRLLSGHRKNEKTKETRKRTRVTFIRFSLFVLRGSFSYGRISFAVIG